MLDNGEHWFPLSDFERTALRAGRGGTIIAEIPGRTERFEAAIPDTPPYEVELDLDAPCPRVEVLAPIAIEVELLDDTGAEITWSNSSSGVAEMFAPAPGRYDVAVCRKSGRGFSGWRGSLLLYRGSIEVQAGVQRFEPPLPRLWSLEVAAPLARADRARLVCLEGVASGTQATTEDRTDEGHFDFDALPAGRYRVEVGMLRGLVELSGPALIRLVPEPGLVVEAVETGGVHPALRALGLRSGDHITGVAGQPLAAVGALRALFEAGRRSPVSLDISRDGSSVSLEVDLRRLLADLVRTEGAAVLRGLRPQTRTSVLFR